MKGLNHYQYFLALQTCVRAGNRGPPSDSVRPNLCFLSYENWRQAEKMKNKTFTKF